MAGMIGVSASREWSVASWLFDWALEQTAELLGPGDTADRLREIVEYNLGWFALDELPPAERARVTAAFAALPERGEEKLPLTLARREHVIGMLQELASMVQGT